MSDVLERALASPWNPARARERVESMDRMRGSVVAPQPSLLEDALAAIYRGIRPSQENLGGLVAAIKPVYHGSPHAFDQFKLDKIGTGEGAQAYGHGLYFAESPGVAKSYQKRLAKGTSPLLDAAAPTIGKDISQEAYDFLKGYEDAAKAAQGLRTTANNTPDWIKKAWSHNPKGLADLNAKYLQAADWLDANAARIKLIQDNGHFYEASLRWPDAAREAADPLGPQHFLDWDKPLSEQSGLYGLLKSEALRLAEEKSRAARTSLDAKFAAKGLPSPFAGKATTTDPMTWTGKQLYESLAKTKPDASNYLREAGIPGIRYLDAGSRGAGQGTHNYVVFDDGIIEVLKRNGAPIK